MRKTLDAPSHTTLLQSEQELLTAKVRLADITCTLHLVEHEHHKALEAVTKAQEIFSEQVTASARSVGIDPDKGDAWTIDVRKGEWCLRGQEEGR